MAQLEKKIVVIVGETASGKSKAAMKIAKQFNGEIITADSWTVYKGFDIGTAKPSPIDRKSIKHHLLDVAEPLEGYSAAIFKRQAEEAIDDIQGRGKIPIIVGGTGLYIDSLLYRYSFLPASGPDQRQLYNNMNLAELKKIIIKSGYDTTDIDLNNKRRLIRLLENKGKKPSSTPAREDMLVFGILTERDKLRTNTQKRIKKMLEAGLEQEVTKLAKQYGWEIEPMKGIGYREFREYLKGSIDIEETSNRILKNTLDLAKKQRTWFRRNKSIHWVSNSDEIVGILTTHLNKK